MGKKLSEKDFKNFVLKRAEKIISEIKKEDNMISSSEVKKFLEETKKKTQNLSLENCIISEEAANKIASKVLSESIDGKIDTVEEFENALEKGPYEWPGGYPIYFIVDDGEALSFNAALENKDNIIDSIKTKTNDGWRVVGRDVNWEDNDLYCAHTGEKIECAYCEDEDEEEYESDDNTDSVSMMEAELDPKNASSLYNKALSRVNSMPADIGFGGGKKDTLLLILKNMNPKRMTQSDIDTCEDIIGGHMDESRKLKIGSYENSGIEIVGDLHESMKHYNFTKNITHGKEDINSAWKRLVNYKKFKED